MQKTGSFVPANKRSSTKMPAWQDVRKTPDSFQSSAPPALAYGFQTEWLQDDGSTSRAEVDILDNKDKKWQDGREGVSI